jgi:hypothetical protein
LKNTISLSSGVPFQELGRYTVFMDERPLKKGPVAGSTRRVCTATLMVCVVGGAAVLNGCAEPLLTPDEPRSQYDRTDAVRDRRAPSYVEDEFGTRRPNIRGRLVRTD